LQNGLSWPTRQPEGEALLEAVDLLKDLNRRGARRVPDGAPVGLVPRSWRPYVHPAEGGIDRHHWELCLLSELRGALRAGEIWVQGSRRYTDPERFIIARADWPNLRPSVLHQLELPSGADDRVGLLLERTAGHRDVLDRDLQDGDADVALGEQGNLHVKRLRAEPRELDVDELARLIANQLPVIDLPDLLIEVDRWCHFTRHLTHAGGSSPRRADHARQDVHADVRPARVVRLQIDAGGAAGVRTGRRVGHVEDEGLVHWQDPLQGSHTRRRGTGERQPRTSSRTAIR